MLESSRRWHSFLHKHANVFTNLSNGRNCQTWASAEFFPGGGRSRHFAYPFQFVGDATQMDVDQKCPMLRQQLQCFPYKQMFVLVRMDILRLS